MIKKYNNHKNISGNLIKIAREKKNMTKTELCTKLELLGININRDELLLMEKNQLMIKDFELIAIALVLELDLNELKKILTND